MTTHAGERAKEFRTLKARLDADTTVLVATIRRDSPTIEAYTAQVRLAVARLEHTVYELHDATQRLATAIRNDLDTLEGTNA